VPGHAPGAVTAPRRGQRRAREATRREMSVALEKPTARRSSPAPRSIAAGTGVHDGAADSLPHQDIVLPHLIARRPTPLICYDGTARWRNRDRASAVPLLEGHASFWRHDADHDARDVVRLQTQHRPHWQHQRPVRQRRCWHWVALPAAPVTLQTGQLSSWRFTATCGHVKQMLNRQARRRTASGHFCSRAGYTQV
jgi:hypothetical protein